MRLSQAIIFLAWATSALAYECSLSAFDRHADSKYDPGSSDCIEDAPSNVLLLQASVHVSEQQTSRHGTSLVTSSGISAVASASPSVGALLLLSPFLLIAVIVWLVPQPWEDQVHSPSKDAAMLKEHEVDEVLQLQRGEPIPEAAVPGGVIALFEKQVQQHPNAVALLDAESSTEVTYAELARSVDLLAKTLTEQIGVRKGDVVGMMLQPSRSFVVATLAVMKAGAAWLPLDSKSPGPRLKSLLERAGACVALAHENSASSCIDPFPTCLLSANGEVSAASSVKALQPERCTPPDLAAIFYTSGSSGESKAVMYAHDTICHGALTFGKLCKADSSSVFLIKTPTIWAVSEYEVFTPLIFGARAVVSAESQRDITKLVKSISEHKVTTLVTSAPVLQLLADEHLPSLRHAVNVGAALPIEVCTAVGKALGSSLSLHNLYGCTESPCLTWSWDPAAPAVPGSKLAPAGLPQPGSEVQVLDKKLESVPPGQPGEVCIGGPYLSRGYLGDEPLTNQRFVVKPDGSGRLYRTGDVGRWVKDGAGCFFLQVEGRTDRQLNINGVRVSPEEVEAVLSRAPGVKEVAVVATEKDIVAGVAGSGSDLKASVETHAKSHLPAHMRPAVILVLDSLAKLGNGKIDLVSMQKLASDAVQQGAEVQALDSLGVMRKVKREAARELQVVSALRGWASLWLMAFHWIVPNFVWAEQGPYYFNSLFVGIIASDFMVPLFIIASAYTDSKQAHTSKLTENLLVIVLFALGGTLIPLIVQGEMWANNGYGGWSSHRWYLQYYLICNLLHSWIFLPLRQNVPQQWLGFAKIAAILAVCKASTVTGNVNVCQDVGIALTISGWISDSGCWLIPWGAERSVFFGLLPDGMNQAWLFVAYAVVWWYGPDLVAWLVKRSESLRWNPLPLLCVLLVSMTYWTGSQEYWNTPYLHGNGGEVRVEYLRSLGSTIPYHLYAFAFALFTALVMAFGSKSEWFPLSALAFLGRFSLGTYLIHWYIKLPHEKLPWLTAGLARIGGWPGDGLVKLAVLLCCLSLYAATVGRLAQFVLVDGTLFAFSKIGEMYSSAVAAVAAGAEQVPPAAKRAHDRWNELHRSCFDKGGVLCLDGGTGSEVQREAERLGHDEAVNSEGWSCVQWKTHPDVLRGVHTSYLRSGAKLVISNSYATNRHIMKAAGYEDLTRRGTTTAVCLACEARDAVMAECGLCEQGTQSKMSIPTLVAGSMSCHPPGMAHGANMDAGKWPAPEVEFEGYREQAELMQTGGADVIFVEMVWEWKEHGVTAVRAANSCGLPVVVCFAVFNEKSCEEDMPQLHDGTLLEEVAQELATGSGWNNVVGICIHHTKLPLILPCLMAIREGGWKGIVGAYPDHGTFEMPHWRFEPLKANEIVGYIAEWVEKARCQMVGGCCGIGPETIKLVSEWCEKFNAGKGVAT